MEVDWKPLMTAKNLQITNCESKHFFKFSLPFPTKSLSIKEATTSRRFFSHTLLINKFDNNKLHKITGAEKTEECRKKIFRGYRVERFLYASLDVLKQTEEQLRREETFWSLYNSRSSLIVGRRRPQISSYF